MALASLGEGEDLGQGAVSFLLSVSSGLTFPCSLSFCWPRKTCPREFRDQPHGLSVPVTHLSSPPAWETGATEPKLEAERLATRVG